MYSNTLAVNLKKNPQTESERLLKFAKTQSSVNNFDSIEKIFSECVTRRSNHEPFAYIVGYKEFYKHKFKVSKHTLIPRPDTEVLVESSIKTISDLIENNLFATQNKLGIIELGVGTGAVILSVLDELRSIHPHVFDKIHGTAIDISPLTLEVAKDNAEQLSLKDKITFVRK